MKCYVKNKLLVDILHSTKEVDDTHLRINLSVLGNMLECRVLSIVSMVHSMQQLANVFYKRKVNKQFDNFLKIRSNKDNQINETV